MQFPLVFKRNKGGGTPVLGADTVPTAAPTGADNQLSLRPFDQRGFPVQRIAVALTAPNGSAAIPVALYLWEAGLKVWLACGAQVSMAPSSLYWFSVPAVAEQPATIANLAVPGGGSLSVLAIPSDPGGGAPSGLYTFAMAPSMTSSP